jgi:HAD superfamily hydrolase (TIGR01509 family)
MTQRTAVLLDVDGTLVDSNYFHVVAWFRALRKHERTVPFNVIHRLIGMGADQLLERLDVGDEADDIEKAWQKEFVDLRDEIAPTPGAGDLVRTLHERGFTTVYATSGQPDDVEALRKVIGADDHVDEVVNSSEVEESKPAPDIFRLALERAGVGPEHAIVVGDTVWDVEAAKACGLECVAVTTGGISAAELTGAGAVAVFGSPADLLRDLDGSPLGRLGSTARR